MYTVLFFILAGLSVFLLGYYFGNQMGRTEYIRNYLSQNRKSQ